MGHPLSALSILFFLAFPLSAQTPQSLLPADQAISGFSRDTRKICLTDTATDAASLYDVIDGGANEYTDRGYRGSVYQGYTNGTNALCVEIYDQSTPAQAKGVFAHFGTGGEYRVITGVGDTARLDSSPMFDNILELTCGRFFIRIIISESKAPAMVDRAADFGRVISGAIIAVEKTERTFGGRSLLTHTPEPALGRCSLEYTTQAPGPIPCQIYDAMGRFIMGLQLSGKGPSLKTAWDGTDMKGKSVAAGRYMAVVQDNGRILSRRITLKH